MCLLLLLLLLLTVYLQLVYKTCKDTRHTLNDATILTVFDKHICCRRNNSKYAMINNYSALPCTLSCTRYFFLYLLQQLPVHDESRAELVYWSKSKTCNTRSTCRVYILLSYFLNHVAKQKEVTTYFSSKQLLPFGFADQHRWARAMVTAATSVYFCTSTLSGEALETENRFIADLQHK